MKKEIFPEYLTPLYPYRAVGDIIDLQNLPEDYFIKTKGKLFELKCPNPECQTCLRLQGSHLKDVYQKLLFEGCPTCKLQFEGRKYVQKEGENIFSFPENDGRYTGFIVKRVIKVPYEIFKEFSMKLFSKDATSLNRDETDQIAEQYYKEHIEEL